MNNQFEPEFIFKNEPIEILLAISPSEYRYNAIVCRATHFDLHGNPDSWGVYKDNSVLSKSLKLFIYERNPSSRDARHFEDCRFNSKEEAISFFKNNFKDSKINKTLEENFIKN